MTTTEIIEPRLFAPRPDNFEDWRRHLDRLQIPPVIAITGSRGKTSVLRAVESIFRAGGHRFASWTNRGVEIEGERQRGELGPWSRALTRLGAGGLDIALQELDWATLQTASALGNVYPVVGVVNLCGNSDACLATPETLLARRALARLQSSIPDAGRVVLNADDFLVSEEGPAAAAGRFLIGISADTPVLRRHLRHDGDALWIEDGAIVMHEAGESSWLVDLNSLGWARDGSIPFAVHNALMAAAIARSCGVPAAQIAAGLADHDARPESMPGSFNIFDTGEATVVVDRPMPSWFLRTSLRAVANLAVGRQIRVVGPMPDVMTDDLQEVGRLLGRQSGVVVIHGAWGDERLEAFRQGVAGNQVPPIFLQAADERAAIQQGLDLLRAGDLLLVLAEDAPAAVRLIGHRVRQRPPDAGSRAAGAA
ncbi:MAG: hypothetical protein IT338_12275 [Thermomicrobiales bacterium]|nr:hypothetical protein [Thermomicrobiales bacterium]